ncbi:MAG: PAS domain-containing protein [Blastocatellia bacterium]
MKLVAAMVLLAGLVIVLSPAAARAQRARHPKGVLVLYWYNKDFPGNVIFDQNFQAALQSAPGGTVEYYPEYFETDRFPGESYEGLLRDYLRRKYADRTIDVVVAAGDPPLEFLLKYRNELFPHTPIVFAAAKVPAAEVLAAGPGMTGFIILGAYKETLDLALKLHPDTEKVFVVSGTLAHDKKYEMLCRERLRDYDSGVAITYLTDLPSDELVAKMRNLPKRSVVLYIWQQAYDEEGGLLESKDILTLVTASATAPVYGLSSWQVGKGIVGGQVLTLEARGAKAAEIALRIVNGARAQEIAVQMAPLVPMFDWRELKRWGISERSLPPESVVRFRVPTFWEQNQWYILVVLGVVAIQSTLIVVLVINHSRRKRAEIESKRFASLAEAQHQRLNDVVSHAPGIVWESLIQPDGHTRNATFVSEYAEKMLGYSVEEWLATPGFLPSITYSEDREKTAAIFEGGKEGMVQFRLMTRDGRQLWAEAHLVCIYDEAGSVIGLRGIMMDISKRKQAEEALLAAQESLTIAVEAAHLGTWDLDLTNDFSGHRNLRHDQIFGYDTPQANWGRDIARRHIVEDDLEVFDAAFARALVTGELEFDARVCWPDGSIHWLAARGRFYSDESGRPTRGAGVNFDITERMEAQQALMDLSGKLIRAREDEGARIARELHDDISQRIALISIELDLLSQNPPPAQAEFQQTAQGILKQTLELMGEIHRLSHDLHPSKLAHLGVVAALQSLCAELSQAYGLNLEFCAADLPSNLPKDISLCLYRVVQESLNNVVKHSGAKDAQVELRATEAEIRLRISDSGSGFDVESAKSRKGIGLIGMRERLRLVGGTISIDSRISQGTRIDVRVPLKRREVGHQDLSPSGKGQAA